MSDYFDDGEIPEVDASGYARAGDGRLVGGHWSGDAPEITISFTALDALILSLGWDASWESTLADIRNLPQDDEDLL